MANTQLHTAKAVLAEQLQDRAVRAEWDAQAPARALAVRLVQYRVEHGLTQSALARLLALKQPAVARLESGAHTPTIGTLLRIAEALEIEILIDIKPATKRRSWVTSRADGARVVERVTTAKGSEVLAAAS